MQDQAPRASPRLRTPAMSYALGGSNGSTSTPTTTILTPPNLPTRFGSDNHPQRTSSYPTANKPRSILPPQVTRAHPSSTPLSQYTYNRPWSSLLECQDRGDTRSGNSESHSLSLLQKYLSDDSLLLSTLLSRRCPLTFHCITYPDFVDLGLFDPCYKHLRVNYDSRSETLKLWMPNTPLHDCVQHWASEMLTRIGRHMLTDDEADSLRGVNPSVRLPTSLYTSTHTPTDEYINEKDSPLSSDEPTSRNASRWQNAKRKMTALSPLQSPAKSTLRIIKWQTTQETGGRTKVAIAVLFGETDSPLPLRRRELWDKYALAFQERLDAEASLLDNDSGEHRTSACPPPPTDQEVQPVSSPSSSLSDPPSDASDHCLRRETIHADDWVGNITARVKIYRFDPRSRGAYRDGPSYLIDSAGTVPPIAPPSLTFSDLFPSSSKDAQMTDARRFELQWSRLAYFIAEAKKEYAFIRELDLIKECKKEFPV